MPPKKGRVSRRKQVYRRKAGAQRMAAMRTAQKNSTCYLSSEKVVQPSESCHAEVEKKVFDPQSNQLRHRTQSSQLINTSSEVSCLNTSSVTPLIEKLKEHIKNSRKPLKNVLKRGKKKISASREDRTPEPTSVQT